MDGTPIGTYQNATIDVKTWLFHIHFPVFPECQTPSQSDIYLLHTNSPSS